MKTYYIYAVQSPDRSAPVHYRTERHRPRHDGESVGTYTQAYVASTGGQTRFAAGSVRATSRADALARYFAGPAPETARA